MSIQSLFLFALVASSEAIFTENVKEQKVLFEAFKAEHGKTYESETEDSRRFGFFVDNLKLADEHQAEATASGVQDHSIHGITQYFDMDLVSVVSWRTHGS